MSCEQNLRWAHIKSFVGKSAFSCPIQQNLRNKIWARLFADIFAHSSPPHLLSHLPPNQPLPPPFTVSKCNNIKAHRVRHHRSLADPPTVNHKTALHCIAVRLEVIVVGWPTRAWHVPEISHPKWFDISPATVTIVVSERLSPHLPSVLIKVVNTTASICIAL